ncbi:MAG: SusC/RagA family TonB-linked outer membrane protein [Bacteroidales bacterium]|nr:SusC/RagA family TonB-linked outer membrane protein [Bacteroidales bacterium]
MKKLSLFLLSVALLLCGSQVLSAQTRTLKGVVVDGGGIPVIGAALYEEGNQSRGVTTDVDGNFSLVVTGANAEVTVVCLGYQTRVIPASSPEFESGRIVLTDDQIQLEDVVVIGYGTVRKSDMTGSIAAVKAEEINRGAVSNSYELLQGKVSGLLVLPDGTLRVRGISSLNASNSPLIVVDGVPLNANGLSSINPDDIDSFSVLKDASSAAIYGSRAASGVILVTTKKASASRKPRVSYSGSVSLSHYIGREDVMGASEYRTFMRQLYADRPGSLAAAEALMGDADTDWISLVTRVGQRSTHNLSVSGTAINGHLPYRVSLGYMQSRGQTLGSWSHRPTVTVSLTPTFLDDHLSVSLMGKVNTSFSDPGSASYSSAANFNPTLPVYFYNPDGSIDYDTNYGYYIDSTGRGDDLVPGAGASTNPMQYRTSLTKPRNLGWTLSSVILYKVHGLEDLQFNLRTSTDRRASSNWSRSKPGYWGLINDSVAPRVGLYTLSDNANANDMLEFYANYNHDFGGHRIDAMAGYSYERFYNYNHSEQHYNEDYVNEAKGVNVKKDDLYGSITRHGEKHFLVSFYGRVNYSYKGRYLATFTLRNDGSSRFAPDHRWGLFPSAALAWNIKEESFLKDARGVDELKLRFGWGVTGQESGIANYSYLANYKMSTGTTSKYNMGSDGRVFNLTPSAYDPNIKWEETITTNIGVDFSFGKDLVSGNIDVYKKDTKDLLNTVLIPMGANFSNELLTNIGSMSNKGIELGLNYNPIRNRISSLMIGANLTFQDTKFTKLTVGDESTNADYYIQTGGIGVGTGGYSQQHRVGYAPRTFFLYQQAYDKDGKPIQNAFVDRDGDGMITDSDRYLTGKSPLPSFFYGLRVKYNYKNWDFGFNAHGSAGNWVFWNYHQNNSTVANDWINYSHLYNYRKIVNRTGWTNTNMIAQSYSDYFLHDASFFKIDDVNVGYTFPKIFGNARLRLALTANNLLTITKYPGVNPEIGEGGIDGSGTPLSRTYTLRVNLNF